MTQEPSPSVGLDERLAAEAEFALDACCQPVSSVVTVPPVQQVAEEPSSQAASPDGMAVTHHEVTTVASQDSPVGPLTTALEWLAAPIDMIPPGRRVVVDWIAWSLLAWVPIVWIIAVMG